MASTYYERNREAVKAKARARYQANREQVRAQQNAARQDPAVKRQLREHRLRSKFGITVAEYDAMLEKQDGKCAICGSHTNNLRGRRFAVDHDHGTGQVRGLLCHGCNAGIGNLKDDPENLEKAAAYLRRTKEQ